MATRLDIAVGLYDALVERRVRLSGNDAENVDRFWDSIVERLGESEKYLFGVFPDWTKDFMDTAAMMAELDLFHLPSWRVFFEFTEIFDPDRQKAAGIDPSEVEDFRGMEIRHGLLAEEHDGRIDLTSFMYLDVEGPTRGWNQHPVRHSINVHDLDDTVRYGPQVPGEGYAVGSLVVFVVLLNTTGVNVENVTPPEKLNRKRTKGGKTAFFNHKVINLNLTPTGKIASRSPTNRASPRLHIRRGHIRFKNRPKHEWKWIKPTLVGLVRNGVMTHEYHIKEYPTPTG